MSQVYQLNHALYPPGTVVQKLIPDSGTTPVVPNAANAINLIGDGVNITTIGSLNTLTVTLMGTTDHAVQLGNAAGNLTSLAVGTDGQVLIGATGADPAFATITSADSSIVFTPGANTLDMIVSGSFADTYTCDVGSATPAAGILTVAGGNNIATSGAGSTVTIAVSGTTQYAIQVGDATGSLDSLALGNANQVLTSNGAGANPSWEDFPSGGISWQVVTGVAANIAKSGGYIANNGAQTVLTLPATAAVGDTYRVTGMNNATGWKIAQNAGQTIHFGAQDTTTGAGGYLESTATYDAVELVCNVANTDFIVLSVIGNLTVN